MMQRTAICAAWTTICLPCTAIAQTTPTCIADDTSCLVQHNDAVALGAKLDSLHSDMQALLKALQEVRLGTAIVKLETSKPTTDPYFPANVGDALFPSPENSRTVRLHGVISGKPYELDSTGAVHQLVQPTEKIPTGYTINGNFAGGGGSDEPIALLLVRQGKVFAQRAGGQWQLFNPGMGSLYNASLPDAFVKDTSGNTTSTSTASSPARPARANVAPGSSGRVLKVCATGCRYSTLTSALSAAANGDTVDLAAGRYKEAPPAIAVAIKIVWQAGAILDLTGLTQNLAHGKGAIVPMTDIVLVNPVITGTAMDQKSAQGTAAIRPEKGCNYIDVQGGELFKNQNGVAGGDVPVVLTMTGTRLHDNGLGDGYTHNIYMSNGTLAVNLTNVVSINPNGGHALKSRAFNTEISGGEFEAFAAAPIDIPQGSISQAVLDGVSVIKKVGAYNHSVINYAVENNDSGNGGMLIKNSTLRLDCDNPFFNVGGSSVVTIAPSTKLIGTKPTIQGGKVVGL